MKILIAADIFPPEGGGPATYVVQFANAMKERGHEIKIVSLNPNSDEAKVSCPLFKVSSTSKIQRYFEYISFLFRYAKDADVIFAMGPVNAGLPAFLVSSLRNKKFVVKVVGDYAWEQGTQRFGVNEMIDEFQNKKYGRNVEMLRWVQRLVVQKAQTVLVPSQYLKKMVQSWGADSVSVVANAVPFSTATPFAKPVDEQWIISVGRLVPWKGFSVLIEAVQELKDEFPKLKLKIIGDGPERKNIEKQVTSSSQNIELLGNLSHEKTLSLVATADIFILNSAYEGMSHVILEALYLKRTILASKIGANKEVITDRENGLLFEYNNKEEIKEKIRMVLRGEWKTQISPDLVEKYSIENMIKNTEIVLKNVCS